MENQPPATKEEKKNSWFRELVNFALIAIFIVLPFRIFVAQPFIVSGDSMDPTFINGQYLIVDQISYHFEEPARDSVVIFKYPLEPSKFFIKRIIGLPGETINIKDGKVYITKKTILGTAQPSFELSEPYLTYLTHENFSITLKDDEYFVLGDNRPRSSDSRFWGPVARKFIIGRPILRLLPVNTVGIFPGNYSSAK